MPIRPENLARYPADWPQIRERMLTRAGQARDSAGSVTTEARCEQCGVENHAIGVRDSAGNFTPLGMGESEAASLDGEHVIQVVLTIAHVHDMNPESCTDDNLAALCQRCHNRHDVPHRRQTRARTQRAREEANGQLFLTEA